MCTFGSTFRMSRIVGRMSIVSTHDWSTFALFWPGALMNNGIGAISRAVVRLRRRRSRAGGKATPGCAAATRCETPHAAVSHRHDQRLVPQPLRLQPLPELLELVVREACLKEVALEQ